MAIPKLDRYELVEDYAFGYSTVPYTAVQREDALIEVFTPFVQFTHPKKCTCAYCRVRDVT